MRRVAALLGLMAAVGLAGCGQGSAGVQLEGRLETDAHGCLVLERSGQSTVFVLTDGSSSAPSDGVIAPPDGQRVTVPGAVNTSGNVVPLTSLSTAKALAARCSVSADSEVVVPSRE